MEEQNNGQGSRPAGNGGSGKGDGGYRKGPHKGGYRGNGGSSSGYRKGGNGGYRKDGKPGFRGDGDRKGGYRGDKSSGYRGKGGYRNDDDRKGDYRGNGGYRNDDDRRGGHRNDDDRRGGYRGGSSDDGHKGDYRKGGKPGGYRTDDRKGGYRGNGGGYRKDDRKDSYRGGKPGYRGDRDGDFSSHDDRRGGYRGRDDFKRDGKPGGYRKDDRRGGYRKDDRHDGHKGGYRKDDREGFKGGYRGKSDGYRGDDRKGGYRKDDRRDGYRGGDERRGGYRSDDDGRKPFGGHGDGSRGNGKFRDERGPRREGDRKPFRGRDDRREGEHHQVRSESGGFQGFASDKHKPSESRGRVTPARRMAHQILTDMRENECYLSESIARCMADVKMRSEERSFARLLVTEVVCREGCLDELIDSVLENPEELNSDVRDALRISFCELFYLGKPDHVAADQGVELVRSFEPRASRLANFALRRAVEAKPEFPFGDPETDDRAAGLVYGFPQWLVERLVAELGRPKALCFMKRANDPAPLFFMVNVARVDGAATLAALVKRGLKVVPIKAPLEERPAYPVFAFAERTAMADPEVERMLDAGEIVVSDAVAQGIAMLSLPDFAPERFLEIGAGRGTKSILLQNAALARFGKQMTLDTLDKSAERTRERTARLKRARISEEHAYLMDATDLSEIPEASYDAVFVDAPCSGVGTLRRHPEIRWRLQSDAITSLAHVGSEILAEAARLVAPGGRLTYATCTVFSEENDAVISAFLESAAGEGFSLVKTEQELALADEEATGPIPDAHFVAIFQRDQALT